MLRPTTLPPAAPNAPPIAASPRLRLSAPTALPPAPPRAAPMAEPVLPPICWPTTEPKTPPNAPPTPASVVPPAMAAPLTRPRDNKRIEENFIERPQEDDGAILRLYRDTDNRKPTSGTGCIQFAKLLFFMGNLSDFCESLTTSERPLLCKSGLFCASQKVCVTAGWLWQARSPQPASTAQQAQSGRARHDQTGRTRRFQSNRHKFRRRCM